MINLPPTSGWFASKVPGMLRNGNAIRPLNDERNPRQPRACQASGTSSVTITTATTLALSAVAQDTDETAPESWLATLATNTLSVKRDGWYIAEFTAIIGYSATSGSSGVTMREAKISAWINAGGNVMTASLNKETLSSRRNTSGLVTAPGVVEQTVDVGGATGKTNAFTTQEDVPFSFNSSDGYLTDVSTTVDLLTPAGLDGAGKMPVTLDSPQSIGVDSNIERIEDYAPALFQEKTITGKVLIQVVPTDATTYKIRIAGVNYDGTLKVEASVTYGGDGTEDPVAVCTACTLTLLKI